MRRSSKGNPSIASALNSPGASAAASSATWSPASDAAPIDRWIDDGSPRRAADALGALVFVVGLGPELDDDRAAGVADADVTAAGPAPARRPPLFRERGLLDAAGGVDEVGTGLDADEAGAAGACI
mmetsp:Transcript_11479/g.29164  ORF Transcript_11479/g.29164 Transcript_11479/m.29164 type:complete len:126 (-) Transcript_11479:15-392(-)